MLKYTTIFFQVALRISDFTEISYSDFKITTRLFLFIFKTIALKAFVSIFILFISIILCRESKEIGFQTDMQGYVQRTTVDKEKSDNGLSHCHK